MNEWKVWIGDWQLSKLHQKWTGRVCDGIASLKRLRPAKLVQLIICKSESENGALSLWSSHSIPIESLTISWGATWSTLSFHHTSTSSIGWNQTRSWLLHYAQSLTLEMTKKTRSISVWINTIFNIHFSQFWLEICKWGDCTDVCVCWSACVITGINESWTSTYFEYALRRGLACKCPLRPRDANERPDGDHLQMPTTLNLI